MIKKIISLAVTLTFSLGVVACSHDSEAEPTPDNHPVAASTKDDFSKDDVQKNLEKVDSILNDESKTEQDFLSAATMEYRNELGDKYQETAYDLIRRHYVYENGFAQAEKVVDEKFSDPEISGNTAQSYRDQTLEVGIFKSSPETLTCEVRDTWAFEGDTWKLKSTDRSECIEVVDNAARNASGNL